MLFILLCGLVDLTTFALKREAADSSKMLASWHRNPSDHKKLYFHENLDLLAYTTACGGSCLFCIYDSPNYVAVFYATEGMTYKLVQTSNLTYIQLQG